MKRENREEEQFPSIFLIYAKTKLENNRLSQMATFKTMLQGCYSVNSVASRDPKPLT